MLWITANAKVTTAGPLAGAPTEMLKKFSTRRDLLDQQVFDAVSDRYKVSRNPGDFVYTVARAVSADVPNQNGDAFPEEELLSLNPMAGVMVFQTFINDPLHVEHLSDDPTAALGFILDSHYNTEDARDKFVETLVLIDRKKNPIMAKEISSGARDSFSMGCLCEIEVCSFCNKASRSDAEFCDHMRHMRMQRIGGKLVYGRCRGVTFTELSSVANPADAKARQRFLLAASAKMDARRVPLITRLGFSPSTSREIARYLDARMGELPPSMVELADRLFGEGEA
jgi:hypothetical protein